MATIKNVFTPEEVAQIEKENNIRAEKLSRFIKEFITDNTDCLEILKTYISDEGGKR